MTEPAIPSTHELLVQLKLGDEEACEPLFVRHEQQMYGHARRRGLPPQQAEEAVQETFLKVFSKIDTYNDVSGSGEKWMWAIHRNTCADILRAVNTDRKLTLQYQRDEEAERLIADDNREKEDMKLLNRQENLVIARQISFDQLTFEEQAAIMRPKARTGPPRNDRRQATERWDQLTIQAYRELFGDNQ